MHDVETRLLEHELEFEAVNHADPESKFVTPIGSDRALIPAVRDLRLVPIDRRRGDPPLIRSSGAVPPLAHGSGGHLAARVDNQGIDDIDDQDGSPTKGPSNVPEYDALLFELVDEVE